MYTYMQYVQYGCAGYVAYKERKHGPLQSLFTVSNVGEQPNDTWALNHRGQHIKTEVSGLI